ncbi:hypothetical protein [Streptomyces sp. NPDC046805]|uniref:hypothetical protein n=1 Tax=Streptomyces sp. NPDC046805 TaxID=3155134 RepID=UPI0033EEB5AC
MPADEVTHGTDVDESCARTGPRHAAPKKPLFTRFHMPAGKAIASVAMPTAVLMGMGFTSTLAIADSGSTSSPKSAKSLTADEYKDCVTAMDGSKDAAAKPSPSESKSADKATPKPSASTDAKDGSGTSSHADSGDTATPAPTPSTPKAPQTGSGTSGSGDTAGTSSSSGGGLLGAVGDTVGGLLGGGGDSGSSTSTSPAPSTSTSTASAGSATDNVAGTVKDTTDQVTKTVGDVGNTVKKTTDTATKTVGDTTGALQKTVGSVTHVASPLTGSAPSADGCPTATDDKGGVDNQVPVADDPWYLSASSLLLKGADYQGVVQVKTANGSTKKVLKYVISKGTDIGDLHQTVKDKQSGKTYHVQAAKGSTSTIRDGKTVMYTESISGNLFGLIPLKFTPDNPPPLNLPSIYFTNVQVTQAAQFGGTLHVPGMHLYTTD